MKTIDVRIDSDLHDFQSVHIQNVLIDAFPNSRFVVRGLPAQPEQGQGEVRCSNCKTDVNICGGWKENCKYFQPNEGIAIAVPAKTAALMADVDDKNLLDLYRKFYAVWNRCESNRGCYSCAEPHDCRCEKDRKISDKCTCGRDDLEAIELEISELLDACHAQGEG